MNKEVQTSVGVLHVKELTFGDDNDATRKALEHCIIMNKPLDSITRKEFLVLESIEERDIIKDYESLRMLKKVDGQKILVAFNELNEVMPGE